MLVLSQINNQTPLKTSNKQIKQKNKTDVADKSTYLLGRLLVKYQIKL